MITPDDVLQWLAKVDGDSNVFIYEKELCELDGWEVYNNQGNISHSTGKFFTVSGMKVSNKDFGWQQPIIVQPEIGILGLVVAFSEGTLHLLVQAKIEPGNINGAQLSPTVQATKSNYFGAHKGKSVSFIDLFLDPNKKIINDSLQSEQGSRFYKKINRNIVIEVSEVFEIPHELNYKWIKLTELAQLSKYDNVVNMDLRTVLACAQLSELDFGCSSFPDLTNETKFFLSKLNNKISESQMRSELICLEKINDWINDGYSISHLEKTFFSVIGAEIKVGGREVKSWHQPVIKPTNQGIIITAVAWSAGGLLIAHKFIEEPGLVYGVEAGPVYQSSDGALDTIPTFINKLINGPHKKWADVLLSEEGGRFFNEVNRNIVVELPYPEDMGEDVFWTPLSVIKTAALSSQSINMCLRSLVYLIECHLLLENVNA